MAKIKHPILTVKCSQWAFNELFERFNTVVKEAKSYKKFNYDDWCKIRKVLKSRCTANDSIESFSVCFDIDKNEAVLDMNISPFHLDDHSFGEFLADELTPRYTLEVLMNGLEVKYVNDYQISEEPTTLEQNWRYRMTINDKLYYKNIIKDTKEINNYFKDVNEHYETVFTDADKYRPGPTAYATTNVAPWPDPIVDNTATKATTNTVKPESLTLDWFATTSTTKPVSTDDLASITKLNTRATINPCTDSVSICSDDLCKNCKNYEKKDNGDKENKMKGFNFDFGKITNDSIRMSMYGMAVKNTSGVWTAYDKATGDLMDVDVFNFDGSNFLFKMPVAIKDIAVGDVVIHARKPMFVVSKTEAGDLVAVDPVAGEKKTIMPIRSPFGFNFATKVISLFDNLMGNSEAPSADNPFGNLWMLMLMDGKTDMKDMLVPMMLMSQANGSTNAFNPMMLMLMSDGDMKDMAIPLMLMNQVK